MNITARHLVVEPEGGARNEAFAAGTNLHDLIPLTANTPYRPDSATILTQVRDCYGQLVFGTEVRLVRADGTYYEIDTTEGGIRRAYFDGRMFPSATQPFTHVDGTAAWVNIPITEGDSVETWVEVWARLALDEPMRVVACDSMRTRTDGGSTIQLMPLRAGETRCPALRP
jgi:hypothetical protein